jgi:serine protease Do
MNHPMSSPAAARQRWWLGLVAAGALGGLVGAASISGLKGMSHPGTAATASVADGVADTPRAATPVALALPDLSQIAQRHGAAVVHIGVSGLSRVGALEGEDAGPDGPPQALQGQGSGFIVGADGLVLTNAHVVRGAKDVTVKLADRREFQARALGIDRQTDVAVLKIDAHGLPTTPLGDPRQLRVGEWVLAIGSPFGFDNSVTVGVVSAKGRSLPDDGAVPFIQTDAAVNPGNSGGPLFNARGEVVGINSQIFSRTGGYEGLSFAIPIDVAVRVKDQIVASGHATHARMGVAVQEVNQALADSFGLDRPERALVSGVEPGGPADKADLKPGDVIRKLDGQATVASGDLPAWLGQDSPGQQVQLEVWRQGRHRTLSARLGDTKDRDLARAGADAPGTGAAAGRLGLALRPLLPQERRANGADAGLWVERCTGPAARAGVQPGDLLQTINGTPITSAEQARRLVAAAGKSVALLLRRDGERIFVPVRLG